MARKRDTRLPTMLMVTGIIKVITVNIKGILMMVKSKVNGISMMKMGKARTVKSPTKMEPEPKQTISRRLVLALSSRLYRHQKDDDSEIT